MKKLRYENAPFNIMQPAGRGGDFFMEVWAVAPFTCRGCAQTSMKKKITPPDYWFFVTKTEQIEKIA